MAPILVRGRRGSYRTSAVVPAELFYLENAGPTCILGLLYLCPVDLDLIANLDTGRVPFKRVCFRVASLEFEPAGARHDASSDVVMAATDFNGHNNGHSNDCTNAYNGAGKFGVGWTNIS